MRSGYGGRRYRESSDDRSVSRPIRRRRRRRPRTVREWIIYLIRTGRMGIILVSFLSFVMLFAGISYAWHAISSNQKEAERLAAEEEAARQAAEAKAKEAARQLEEQEVPVKELDEVAASFAPGYTFERTADTQDIPEIAEDGTGGTVVSRNAVLVDIDNGTIVSEKEADTLIVPASMTKILTLIVAVEQIEDLDATYKIKKDVLDFSYQHDCSVVGFEEGEKVTMRDLLYGTILPSGADAALALCDVVAGGTEPFAELMNEKVKELGLSKVAHFTNAIGIYDDDLHCTVSDMAGIMKAALEDPVCREVLDAHVYTTTKTKQHPEGITISNWFLRRIEDKSTPGRVAGAKTGFVDQSGFCAASYLLTEDGRHFVCVTTNSNSSWRCINDHVDIYNAYVNPE